MQVWVIAANASGWGFYAQLEASIVVESYFELGGARISEVAYGWPNIHTLLDRTPTR